MVECSNTSIKSFLKASHTDATLVLLLSDLQLVMERTS